MELIFLKVGKYKSETEVVVVNQQDVKKTVFNIFEKNAIEFLDAKLAEVANKKTYAIKEEKTREKKD